MSPLNIPTPSSRIHSPTDSLAEGEKQADNIVFSINDGKGHTVTQPINVVIKGGSVETLFAGAEHAKGVDAISGVEVMVSASGDALNNLTDMAEIASKTGVSISTGSDGSTSVSFDASHTWKTSRQTASNGTVWDVHSTTITTDSGSEAVQVAVQHLTTNQGG